MALNLKNPEVERLANEVATLAGESKTQAIKVALAERRERLTLQLSLADRPAGLRRFFELEVWPLVPEGERGRRMTRAEEEEMLGFSGSER